MINAWHDARVREAIRRTGRRQVVIAGTGLDVCARLPALAASAEGFEAYVAIDSCGRFDPQSSIATVSGLAQAGVALVNTRVAVLEMMADNADPRAGEIHATLPAGLVVIDEAG